MTPSRLAPSVASGVSSREEQAPSFAELLSEAMKSLNELTSESDRKTIEAALGRPVELHQVMLAATKASLAMELLIEIRNRLIEAYQEISRMPV